MALVRNILIFCQLLPLMRTINLKFFPCDTDENGTFVDCKARPLTRIPFIKADSVGLIDLTQTKIHQVQEHAFDGLPNLHTIKIRGNCQPGKLRALTNHHCKMVINENAFKSLQKLKYLYLSGNSLTSIPRLPESLKVLDLQNNCIFNISHHLGTPHLESLFLSSNCFYANPCNQSFYISEEVFRKLPKLKHLQLGYNNLTAIPKGLPPSLEYLDLRENTITEVAEGAFSNLTHLKHLTLEWNCQRCDHAARPCFPCPNNLPLLLHPNSLFAVNSSLSYLSLRGNSLRTFPQGLFTPLVHLKRLDISDNLLACAIQNGTFFGELKGLLWISLIYNYEPLVTFQELILSPHISKMSSLQEILLTGNFFRTLSKESLKVLSELRNLTKIELRMNFINSSDLIFVKELQSLIFIDLSQNMLTFLPSCSNSSSQLVTQGSCHTQNLYSGSYNDQPLIFREREVFSDKCSVERNVWESNQSDALEVLEDNMSDIPADVCNGSSVCTMWDFRNQFCQNELTLDLSQNDILSLNKDMFLNMENVVCLDLSFNYMNQATKGGLFINMKKVIFLNLAYNRLDLYYKDAFRELKSTLKVLDISNNEFHFKMRGMGHRLEFLQNLINLEVLSLANNGIGMRVDQRLISKSLKYLYFSGNHLDLLWQSENKYKYTHFFQNLTNLIYLDISNNHLKSVSPEVLSNLPRSLEGLRISDNMLDYFPWQNISALGSLRHLNLSQNFLWYLPPNGTEFGANFSVLDLSHNHFSFIPEDFFSTAHALQYLYLSHNQIKELNHHFLPALFKNGSSLVNLTLHANPFKCDCDTSWFADFLRTTPIKIPYLTTHVHCEFPESQQGQSILSIDQRSCQDIYGSSAFLICSFLTVMFTVLPLLKHLYGWDMWYCMQVLWAGHKGYSQLGGLNSQYLYDAFVVFDTNNQAVRDWVYNELTVHLENCGHRRFCLCLEERDWIPGLSCIDNLHNAVHNSLKTVFVLSRGANGSEAVPGVIRQAFFMVQQRLLDEKVDAAVLILLDEMFPKLKYLQLRKRLCKKSVLSWPRHPRAQPLFWNRMRMALSSDNIKFYDNKMSESFL
ncbi:toll-like receptor 9 [Salarias fasciatus]|uniref:Toll-like receptor 9 n=1 Tax=Salarias fasciatus TaxID=181472 RepID=A0A672IU74_SALFA|nr:toll-like receptor 9 [Salarias fasciatus]